jgi:hypothetical protein
MKSLSQICVEIQLAVERFHNTTKGNRDINELIIEAAKWSAQVHMDGFKA